MASFLFRIENLNGKEVGTTKPFRKLFEENHVF